MLTSSFTHAVDAKNRLFIPAKHREELGEEFIIAKSLREQCLTVYSKEGWEAHLAPIKEKLQGKDKEAILRRLHANSIWVTPDAQGRIVLTPQLIEFANIAKNAVVVGCGDWSEIWAEEVYNARFAAEDDASLLEALESVGL